MKSNEEIRKQINSLNPKTYVDQLIWLAVSRRDVDELEALMADIDHDAWMSLFREYIGYEDDCHAYAEYLSQFSGFFAVVYREKCPGVYAMCYIYAETLETLHEELIAISEGR